MKKLVVLIALLVTMLVAATPVYAQPGQTDVCPTYDGKYEIGGGGWEGTPAPGITIGSGANDEVVTVTVADGYTLSQFCYKVGSKGGGSTSAEAPIVGPATFTINKTAGGSGVSHITFNTESSTVIPVGGAIGALAFTALLGVALLLLHRWRRAPGDAIA